MTIFIGYQGLQFIILRRCSKSRSVLKYLDCHRQIGFEISRRVFCIAEGHTNTVWSTKSVASCSDSLLSAHKCAMSNLNRLKYMTFMNTDSLKTNGFYVTGTRKITKSMVLERPQHPQTPKLCGKRSIIIRVADWGWSSLMMLYRVVF